MQSAGHGQAALDLQEDKKKKNSLHDGINENSERTDPKGRYALIMQIKISTAY